jgi:hypothetical protein
MEVGTGHGGRESSIAIDSQDKVHISHASSMDPGLKYCNNTLGTWTCMEVETGISGIGDTSIAIDSNDKIHISYYNETGTTAASGDLVYCNNTLGSWTCTAVETYGYIGYSTSIAIDSNDKPHISHYDGIFEALRYCYTSNFSTWNYRKVDDTGGSITTNGRAIAIKKGRLCDSTSFSSSVHISYYNPTTDDLMYAKIEEQYSYGRL